MTATTSVTVPDLARLLDAVPVLQGAPREISELPGGLTNRTYRVSTQRGDFVVRVPPRHDDLLSINRDNEYRNSVTAAAAGVGAPVVAYLPDAGVLVVEYIDGVPFTDQDFATPGNLARVAESCRRLHSGTRFANDFNVFDLHRDYLSLVRSRGYRLPDGYLEHLPQVEQIRAALAVHDPGTVPCNNTLLAGDFIDDGDQVWLIDYEYAGNNDACFELGNIWSQCHLSLDQLYELVIAYYRRPLWNKIARAQLQGLMSKYTWTLWAIIQQATSELDFDFWAWGLHRYESAVEMFRRPAFARLLEQVQRLD